MPGREYYTIDRSPREIKELWDWAQEECTGLIEHENPYAMGVCAAMNYLMGETEERPQDYKGLFTLQNVLRQAKQAEQVGGGVQSGLDQTAGYGGERIGSGNPKCLLYKAPLLSGDISGLKDGVNKSAQTVGSDADQGGGQG